MKCSVSSVLVMVCCVSSASLFLQPAKAQVIPDGTTNSTVNADGNNFTIENGDRAGNNLFHSFSDFSVPNNGSAFFDNATDINNIFSRVTGGNISNIDGLIRANDANLFLINPAGILFGAGARLDLGGGSFYGSSADSILFEDGEFSAVDFDNPPLLTINAPIGLSFRDNPGDIVNRSTADGSGLQVAAGETLALIGGNVSVEEMGLIFSPGAKIELGGLIESGTVNFTEDGGLSFPELVDRGNVSIVDSSIVGVTFEEGGSIGINAKDLNLNSNAFLAGGNVVIDATETVSLANSASIGIFVEAGGSLNIDAKNFELTSGSAIQGGIGNSDDLNTPVQAGDIIINTIEDVLIDAAESPTSISSGSSLSELENPGNIEITSSNISFVNGGTINNFSNGLGNTGNITLSASGNILFDGINNDNLSAGIINGVVSADEIISSATANLGTINLSAKNLTINNGASISSGVIGVSNSGDININVQDTITVNGDSEIINSDGTTGIRTSQISSNVLSGRGDSGNINITTNNLSVTSGGIISTDNFGGGNAGDINLTANNINIDGQGIFREFVDDNGRTIQTRSSSDISSQFASSPDESTSETLNEGSGGNININTNFLSITNGAQVTVNTISTTSRGVGGNININASENILVDGKGVFFIDGEPIDSPSLISSFVGVDVVGNGGNVDLSTAKLTLDNGAELSVSTLGEGNAGSLTIRATDSLELLGDSNIEADVSINAIGNGGNILINTNQLTLADSSSISASTLGEGNAGSLTIRATDSLELLGDSNISVQVLPEAIGNSGDLNIETNKLTLTDASSISASTFGEGNAGSLTINAPEFIELSGSTETSRGGLFAGAIIGSGNGGDLFIFTDELRIRDGATINVSNLSSLGFAEPGTGEAGNLTIEANSISLNNDTVITAATQSGDGGNIFLQIADNLTLQNNSTISSQAFTDADGGNINIDTNFIVAFPNGNNDIIANAEQGNGGNININAESLLGIEERPLNSETNDINASSEFGLDGTISIFTPDVNTIQTETELPTNPIENQETTAQACRSDRLAGKSSGLTIKGKGGIPVQPTEPFTSGLVIVDGQITNADTQAQNPDIKPIKTSSGDIIPARGIVKTEDGRIILTAYRTDNPTQRTPGISANCPHS